MYKHWVRVALAATFAPGLSFPPRAVTLIHGFTCLWPVTPLMYHFFTNCFPHSRYRQSSWSATFADWRSMKSWRWSAAEEGVGVVQGFRNHGWAAGALKDPVYRFVMAWLFSAVQDMDYDIHSSGYVNENCDHTLVIFRPQETTIQVWLRRRSTLPHVKSPGANLASCCTVMSMFVTSTGYKPWSRAQVRYPRGVRRIGPLEA